MAFSIDGSAGTWMDRGGRYLKTALKDLPKLVPLPKNILRHPCQVQYPEYVFILRPAYAKFSYNSTSRLKSSVLVDLFPFRIVRVGFVEDILRR